MKYRYRLQRLSVSEGEVAESDHRIIHVLDDSIKSGAPSGRNLYVLTEEVAAPDPRNLDREG